MVAVVALTGCSSVSSDPEASSPDPSASVIEIVPGALLYRENGKTRFTRTPVLSSVTIRSSSDSGVTKTFRRKASAETARLLDELAAELARPDGLETEGAICTTEGILLPTVRVTVDGYGFSLDPTVPLDGCRKPRKSLVNLFYEFSNLDTAELTTIN